jgi:hypothetical protein
MRPKLETIANGVIIITGFVAIWLFAKVLWPRTATDMATSPDAYVINETLPKPFPVDLSKADRTLLLILDSQCTYCTDSVPFYRELADRRVTRPNQARLVAVGFETAATLSSYLSKHGVHVDEVVHVTPDTFRVTGTPSLLLVDRRGRVKGFWKGVVPSNKRAEVLKSLDVG